MTGWVKNAAATEANDKWQSEFGAHGFEVATEAESMI